VEGVGIGRGPERVRECRVPELEDVRRLMAECDGNVPLLIETLVCTGCGYPRRRACWCRILISRESKFTSSGGGAAMMCRRRNRMRETAWCRWRPDRKTAGARGSKATTDPLFTYDGAPIVDNALLSNYVTPRMVKLGIKFPGFGWAHFQTLTPHAHEPAGPISVDLRRQAGHSDVRATQRYIADDVGRRAAATKGLFLVCDVSVGGATGE